MWRHVNMKRSVMGPDLRKGLVFCLKALFLSKNNQEKKKKNEEKNVIFKVFIFWRYSKALKKEKTEKHVDSVKSFASSQKITGFLSSWNSSVIVEKVTKL